jgi:hypothetical protein
MHTRLFFFGTVVAACVVGFTSVAQANFSDCKRLVWGTWEPGELVYSSLTDGGCPSMTSCFPLVGDCEEKKDLNTIPATHWCACAGAEPPCNLRLQGATFYCKKNACPNDCDRSGPPGGPGDGGGGHFLSCDCP